MQVEIHITTSSLSQTEVNSFVSFCEKIDVKPIIIELPEGEVLLHPMISKRVEIHDRAELENVISNLKNKFIEEGYSLSRIKLEVYSKQAEEGKLFFPEFKGGYYEWHGKVFHDDLDELNKLANREKVHISKNGLKGIPNRRILTIRENRREDYFLHKISLTKMYFERSGIEIVDEEYEYCIYDSNKSLDTGWIDTPEITDEQYLNLLSFEGFLRRASTVDLPFMLKGSMLTRQFYKNKDDRAAMDLDFLYFGEVKDDVEFMTNELTSWVEKITSISLDDGIVYKRFSENEFWRAIDYAMSDDFPTTNTDLSCTVYGTENPIIGLDVSWGLPMNVPPCSMVYYPVQGEPFKIRYTAPISLQLSWKMHQCIVRPRLKDLLDLIHILEEVTLSKDDLTIAVEEFLTECQKDEIDGGIFLYFIDGRVRNYLFPQPPKSFLAALRKSNKPKRPFRNLGELEYENIEYLKHAFPNYATQYSNVADILMAFESIMKLNEIDRLLEEKIGEL